MLRKYLDLLLFQTIAPYTKVEALVYLQIQIEKGKYFEASIRSIAKQWKWDKMKTLRFLQELKSQKIIYYEPSSRGIKIYTTRSNVKSNGNLSRPKTKRPAESRSTENEETHTELNNITVAFQQLFLYNAKQIGLPTKKIEQADARWSKPIRELITKDGYNIQHVRIVYNYLKRNEFWKKQIFDTFKLREKFQILLANANSEKPIKQKETITDQQLEELLKQKFNFKS